MLSTLPQRRAVYVSRSDPPKPIRRAVASRSPCQAVQRWLERAGIKDGREFRSLSTNMRRVHDPRLSDRNVLYFVPGQFHRSLIAVGHPDMDCEEWREHLEDARDPPT